VVHDGDGVAGPLDLIEKVGGQHDRAALGHHRQDQFTHLSHPGRVEPVHRLVQEEQLGVGQQARGDPQPLTHAHGVLRDPVVAAAGQADPLQRRPDAVPRGRLACRSQKPQVLPAREMGVEPGFVHDGADSSERRVAMPRDRVSEQGHRASIGAGQSQQHPDERGLAGAVRAEVAERRSPGDQELNTIHGNIRPETLDEPVGLHGPAAPGGQLAGGARKSRGDHPMPPVTAAASGSLAKSTMVMRRSPDPSKRRRETSITGPSRYVAGMYACDTEAGTSSARGQNLASPRRPSAGRRRIRPALDSATRPGDKPERRRPYGATCAKLYLGRATSST
jgi:hypothetical protein